MIDFVAGGMMGDFIQSLYALKNICKQKNEKANLYIANDGDIWKYGLQKAYDDLKDLINLQPYINKFEILPASFNKSFINLSDWRKIVAITHDQTGGYNKCWTEVLSECYNFTISKQYQWLFCSPNNISNNKIVIHRSLHRHNNFPWKQIIDNSSYKILFLTSNIEEWNKFPFKNRNMEVHQASSITEMASIISSSKMFIGNQSAPFSIACALDVPRLVELDYDPAKFYMDEIKYSDNISWFLNNSTKYSATNSLIKL
jgi:ADP-heptose:LPS heptosyltransferase